MKLQHRSLRFLLCACFVFAVCPLSSRGQTTETASAVTGDDIKQAQAMRDAGDVKGAITALRKILKNRPLDATAAYQLGLAHKQIGDKGDAREAFAKACGLHSAAAIRSLYSPAASRTAVNNETVSSERLAAASLSVKAAVDSFEQLLSVDTKPGEEPRIRAENQTTARIFLNVRTLVEDHVNGRTQQIINSTISLKDLDRKPVIGFQPQPVYTQAAREKNISGTVALRVILGADSKVRLPVLLKSVGYGLDEQAIAAAFAISFKPARKGGQAVATFAELAYTFTKM